MYTVKNIVSFKKKNKKKLNMHSFEYHISRGEDDLQNISERKDEI